MRDKSMDDANDELFFDGGKTSQVNSEKDWLQMTQNLIVFASVKTLRSNGA